jgi:hypothetical protein
MREVRVSIKNFLFIKLSTNKAKSLPPKANKTSEPSPQHQHKINPSNIPIGFYLNPFEKLFS